MNEAKINQLARRAERGEFVTTLIAKEMPDATDAERLAAERKVYDAMEYGEFLNPTTT